MFSLPPATLAQFREQAESAFHDTVTFYNLTVTSDVYGNETYSSGIVNSYSCLIGGITGKDEEIVARLVTDGQIKSQTAKCLIPWNADIDTSYIAVVSGIAGDWNIVWENTNATDNYRLYKKVIITRDRELTNYKDKIKRNS